MDRESGSVHEGAQHVRYRGGADTEASDLGKTERANEEVDSESQHREGENWCKLWEIETVLAPPQGKTEEEAKEVGGKIFTFGSYRLGVHGKGKEVMICS